MNLMSENAADLPAGFIGVTLRLGPFATDEPPSKDFTRLTDKFATQCHGEKAFEFNLLTPQPSPLGMHYHFHGHPKADRIAEFAIRIQRKPNDNPPEQIELHSNRLGSFDDGFSTIVSALGSPDVTCRAKLHGHILDPNLIPRPPKVSQRTRKFLPLRFEGETLAFSHKKAKDAHIEISFSGEGEPFTFDISSKISIKLDSTFVEKASNQLWLLLQDIVKTDDKAPKNAKRTKKDS